MEKQKQNKMKRSIKRGETSKKGRRTRGHSRKKYLQLSHQINAIFNISIIISKTCSCTARLTSPGSVSKALALFRKAMHNEWQGENRAKGKAIMINRDTSRRGSDARKVHARNDLLVAAGSRVRYFLKV